MPSLLSDMEISLKTVTFTMGDFQKILDEAKTRESSNKNTDNCSMCGKTPPFTFKNEVSKREYARSKTCQNCQDSLYSGAEV